MSKVLSQYESKNGFYVHEQSLDPLLQLICQLLMVMRGYNQEIYEKKLDKEFMQLTPEESQAVYSEEFYDKIMKENYAFNNFQSLRFLLMFNCTHNEMLSRVLIINILKNLAYWTEGNVSHLEAIKTLLLIEDEYSESRRDMILGVPAVLDDTDFQKNLKFGFQNHRNLDRASVTYLSPLKLGFGVHSFLRNIVSAFERNESASFIMLVYYLQIVNSSEKIFDTMLRFPSPTHQHESFHHWVFGFVKEYLKRDREYNTSTYYRPSRQFNDLMKENLERYEDNLINWARTKGGINPPESILGEFENCANIYAKESPALEVSTYYTKKEVGLCKNPIVGSIAAEENSKELKITQDTLGQLSLRIVELKCRIVESQANGHFNLALPSSAFTGARIYDQDIAKGSAFYNFLGMGTNSQTIPANKDLVKHNIEDQTGDMSSRSWSLGGEEEEIICGDNVAADISLGSTTDHIQMKQDQGEFKYRISHYMLK